MSLPIYEDTKLFIDKEIKIKWQDINDIFPGTFEENLEDHRVYVIIHKSGLYRVACRYPAFPCTNMIHWIVLHTDSETMVLSNVNGTKPFTFKAENFQEMYHLPQLVITMDAPFTNPNSSANSRDILKSWVREPTKFRTTPNQVYKTKILRKAYQFLVVFACCLYNQESTKTFSQSWVVVLDQPTNEGKPFNWSDILAFQLKGK